MEQLANPDIETAWQRRGELHADPGTTAYRIFHGHAEGTPGLNIDRFGDSVLATLKAQVSVDEESIARALESCGDFQRIGFKSPRRAGTDPGALDYRMLRGEFPQEPVPVLDNGMQFVVEPFDRRSPGLFLDARPARTWLLGNSRDRRILNLFSFSGSLGVAAAVGGATEVVHVDLLPSALVRARAHHTLNDVPCDERNFVKGNVYTHLPRAARAGQKFGGIILDPPPELPKGRHKRRLRNQGYPRLARLCAPLLEPGGWLLCFFHRYNRSRAEYEEEVMAHAGIELRVVERGASGSDFPEDNPEQKMRFSVFEVS